MSEFEYILIGFGIGWSTMFFLIFLLKHFGYGVFGRDPLRKNRELK